MIRKDYQKGLRSDGEFFLPEITKPVAVFYTTEDAVKEGGKDIWCQDFASFCPELLELIYNLEEEKRAFRVFGFWPGKGRSDVFPLNLNEVKKRCGKEPQDGVPTAS